MKTRSKKKKRKQTFRVVRREVLITDPVAITVAPQPEKPWMLTQDEVTIVKNSIAKGASDDELKFCLTVARRYRLDPFKKQIWFVSRWDKNADNGKGGKGAMVWIPTVGIDGLLFIAGRDHRQDFGSISLPEYGPMVTVESEGKKFKAPEWAKVKVWKKGEPEPTEAIAWWDEYAPSDLSKAPFWRKMPRRMISKCATALGIRQAYPDLGGLYIPEECERMNEETTPGGRQIIERGAIGTTAAAQEIGRKKLAEHAQGKPINPPAAPSEPSKPDPEQAKRQAASVPKKLVEYYPIKIGDVDLIRFVDSPALAFLCDNGLKDLTVWASQGRYRFMADEDEGIKAITKVAGDLGVELRRINPPQATAPATAAPPAQQKQAPSGNRPTSTKKPPQAATAPVETLSGPIKAVTPAKGRSPLWVMIGGTACGCWHKHLPGTKDILLADVFSKSIGQTATVQVTRTEKPGQTFITIERVLRIGNREYDENGLVRTLNDMGQPSFF